MSAKEKLVAGAALAVGSTILAAVGAALLEPIVVLVGAAAGVAATLAIFTGFRSAKVDQGSPTSVRSSRPSARPHVA